MSMYKSFFLAGAAAFVSSAALADGLNGPNIPLRASALGLSQPGGAIPSNLPKLCCKGVGACGTEFGTPPGPRPPSPDGIIAWNDTSGTGFDTGGGADFTCTKKKRIKKVYVKGYFGTNPEQFNVTFYRNDPADGSDEPNDSQVVCSYTGLIGAAGGQYPTDVTTQLNLTTPCKLTAGHYWVAVQNNDSAGPWYWEVQSNLQGTQADWVDRNDVFGSGCTAFDNDRYLIDCLGYTYPDFMLYLH